MERKVVGHQNMVFTSGDANRMGEFARASLDHVVADGINDGQGYVGFSVVESGPAEITVAPGRYYEAGKVFINDDDGGVTLDLSPNLAAVSKKIVTIVAYGNPTDTETEPRTFLLNPITRATEGRVVSTVNLRRAEISKIAGAENADPQPPAISSNQIAIAHVTVDTTGILSIEMVAANRLPSVKALNTRLVLVEKRLDQAGSAIDTIRTDISGLSARIDTKAPFGFVRDLSLDFARTKRLSELPDDYTAWSADNFATEDQSDKEFAGYNATVKDGLRFGETSALAALALLNPLDPRITVVDNMVMPYNVPRTRLAVTGKDGEVALANYNVSSTVMKKLTRTRTEWEFDDFRWADEFQPAIWGGDWVVTRTPTHFGWDLIDARRKNPQTGVEELWTFNWATVGQDSGKSYTRDYWRHATLKSIDEPYFDQITTTETVEGYQLGQTFLNAQQGALRSLDLFFTRKPATGDVKVFLVELNDAGQPNENRVIYKVEKTPAQVSADLSGQTPTNFDFAGAAMVKGRRYAWHIVSQGSYFLATVAGNKYAQGQLFQKNNGVWQAAASDIDLAFAMYFQGYEATRVEVQLEPAELTGGIARLTINCDTYIPEGTSIEWQGFIGGVWKSLGDVNVELAALATRPSLIQLRAILIGTTDSMPAFGIGNMRSCLTTARNGTALKHISKVRTVPAPVDTVEIILRARHWDSDDHTLACKILTGGSYDTVETADSTVDLQVPSAPEKLKAKKFIFNLAGSVSTYRIQIEGATSDVTNAFIVNERQDVAFAA
jgi:hypothetical protein